MKAKQRPEKHVAGLNPAMPVSDKPMHNDKEIERRDDSMRTSGAPSN
jgi:hypothetical protein